MRKAAIIGLALPIVVLGIFKFIPYLSAETPSVESTPAVQPLRSATPVTVKPNETLCVRGIVLGPNSRYAQFTPEDRRATRPPLKLLVTGPRYSSKGEAARTASGSGPITIALNPPRTEIDGARLCVRNAGNSDLFLFGVPPGLDSTVSETTLNGKVITEDVSLTILSKTSVSRAANVPAMLDHASAFTPFRPWLLWIVSALLVIGVPVSLAVAITRSCPEDQ